MVSGHLEIAYIIYACNAGVTQYLVKTISAKALLKRINDVIEHPRRFVRRGQNFVLDRRRRDVNFK